MDRSFLSKINVIAGSREFICIRPATYEDSEEGKFLKAFNAGRGGDLENSVFCILSPDGKEKLVRAGRSMDRTYATPEAMAEGMKALAAKYRPKALPAALPKVPNVRLALDVASADNQPLVLIYAKDLASLAKLEEVVAQLAWRPEFIGRCTFVATVEASDAKAVAGWKTETSIAVVQPDKFGIQGKLLKQSAGELTPDKLAEALRQGLASFERGDKTFMNHVREGQKQGIFWETVIPVSDKEEAQARERGRSKK